MKRLIALLLSLILTVAFAISVYAGVSINYTFKGTLDGDDTEYIFNFGTFDGTDVTEVGVQVEDKVYNLEETQLNKALSSGKFGIGLSDPKNILGDSFSVTPYIINNDSEETGTPINIAKSSIGGVPVINTLAAVTIGGVNYAEFSSGNTNYKVVLPYGTTTVPEIGYELTDARASAEVSAATSLQGTTTIVVTADGCEPKTYIFSFAVPEKATASIIKVARLTRTTAPVLTTIQNGNTTAVNMRSYDTNLLNNSTGFAVLKFEFAETLPAGSKVVAAELDAHFAQTAGYSPTFNFHNASTDWESFTGTGPLPIDLTHVMGSVSNPNFPIVSTTVENTKAIVTLNANNLVITNGKTINLAGSLVYISQSAYGYIYVSKLHPLPKVNIYYTVD